MKLLSETRALEKLHELKIDFAKTIRDAYEHRAKSCATCETPGACCLDAHFVNVHITRLEAAAIRNVIANFPREKSEELYRRVDETISKYELLSKPETYACPLFERGTGCLVHERGKPLPCIAHACYENKKDLPPEDLLVEQEAKVERLNELTYRRPTTWLPLPVAIQAVKDE